MAIPYKKEKAVRLREFYNSQYQLITILPAWSYAAAASYIGQELDDVVFSRYKDILVDPELFLSTLNSWFKLHTQEFDDIYKALLQQYDPLSNYDMIEKEGAVSLEGEKTSSAVRYGIEKTTQTIPDTKNSRYTSTFDNASEGRLEAYTNQEILAGSAPTLEGYNAQITQTEQIEDSDHRRGAELKEHYAGNVTIEAPESELEGDKGSMRELTRKGNIGVTTSQQMLQSELDLRVNQSFIDIFCKMFARDMTLGVWDI